MIVFRTDASHTVGGGHLARCLALAQPLVAAGETIHVITRAAPGDGTGLLVERGIPHTVLEPDAPDAAATLRALAQLARRPAWLVVDHYGLAAPWETAVRPAVDGILAIDDLANRPHTADVLLDQNPFADGDQRYAGKLGPACRRLFGLSYALLRPEFARARSILPPRRAPIRSIMVSFGAADPDNVTAEVIRAYQAMAAAPPQLHVVIGAHSAHRRELESASQTDKRITVHVNLPHLATLCSQVDLAVGSIGVATWERFCLRVPQLVVGLNATHDAIADELVRGGLVRYLGRREDLTSSAYAAALQAAVDQPEEMIAMAQLAAPLVDGLGAQRVISTLQLPGFAATSPS